MRRNGPDGIRIAVERTGRRKTASIRVDNGRVRVLVPRFLPEREIDALIARRMEWIRETVRVHAGLSRARERQYADGEPFEYLGRRYRLQIVTGSAGRAKLVRGRLRVELVDGLDAEGRAAAIRERLSAWYAARALDRLREKTERYASVLRVAPPTVVVKACESRWGSCSSSGKVMFNWKVIMAPDPIVDYVVVHELCHLLEHNHSPAYWRLVERVIPDYRARRRWLRENGHRFDV